MTKQPKTSKRTAGRRLGAAGGSDLYAAADTLHLSIATMLKDWRDGDFALPKLATIHMQKIEEDYRALGKALLAMRPTLHHKWTLGNKETPNGEGLEVYKLIKPKK